MYFYPRPPRGGRPTRSTRRFRPKIFLSTPSARRATKYDNPLNRKPQISIHALREEGDRCCDSVDVGRAISIHALREEGDDDVRNPLKLRQISIHALREEGDLRSLREHLPQRQFLSTPSARRATLTLRHLTTEANRFLSTPSARRATLRQRPEHLPLRISIHALREEGDYYNGRKVIPITISIHALREEGDPAVYNAMLTASHFYPRPPRGGRPLPRR